uniref:hypothetical protein n=1 Tax=uncultured Duncaniella sp. TaxID=2768039 RepID=UPI0027330367
KSGVLDAVFRNVKLNTLINKLDLGSLKQQDKKIVLEEIIKDLDLIVMRLKSLVEEESHGKDHS